MTPNNLSDFSAKYPRIFISGGAGFIGSHLTERLLGQGCKVSVLDSFETGSLSNLKHLEHNPHLKIETGSVLNVEKVSQLTAEADLVFHLAAAVGVQHILKHPLTTLKTNLGGTEVMLEMAAKHRKKIFVASTSEVYGKGLRLPFREDDDILLGPTSKSRWAYAASKMVDEFLALAYFEEQNLPVVTFRLFNTVGPRQTGRYGMVLPRLIQQGLQGEPLTIYGTGEQTRCFCDVNDVIEALLQLSLNESAHGQILNIGNTESVSLNQLAQKILDGIEKVTQRSSQSKIVHIAYDQVFPQGFEEIQHRRPDIKKIQNLTGWQPQVSLNNIIEKIIISLKERLP